MAETRKLGSVKRFGPRYGRRLRLKLAKVESVQRGKHTCPYCKAVKVKRMAVGIWYCSRCKSKFTGKAYSVSAAVSTEEVEEKPKQEAKEEA